MNGQTFTVIEVINTGSFIIDCDTTKYSPHERDGIVTQQKAHIDVSFKPLKEILDDRAGQAFDQNLIIADFEKMGNFKNSSLCYKLLGDQFDDQALLNPQVKEVKNMEKDERDSFNKLATAFCQTKRASIGPISAFIGGVVVQEIVKAITKKYMPICQEFYFDTMELFAKPPTNLDAAVKPNQKRYKSFLNCFGQPLLNEVRDSKVFMIGAGAIGCELLKNFAMLGLGSGDEGKITLTDPDIIELSNLNRQFLFREKHIRKPKSLVAAAAAVQMNPQLKNHVSARLDKIHKDTEEAYPEEFYKK